MDKKLSLVADYLDSRRKSSSYESHRLREVEAQHHSNNTILLNSGSNYMNLKEYGVLPKKTKFSDIAFYDEDELNNEKGSTSPGYEGDPDLLDFSDDELSLDSDNNMTDDIFGDEEDIFGDEEDFLDLSDSGIPGEVKFQDSSLAKEEGPLNFDNSSLSREELNEDDRFPFGRKIQGHPSSEDPLRNYIGHSKYSSRKEAWLKEAKAENLFQNI